MSPQCLSHTFLTVTKEFREAVALGKASALDLSDYVKHQDGVTHAEVSRHQRRTELLFDPSRS